MSLAEMLLNDSVHLMLTFVVSLLPLLFAAFLLAILAVVLSVTFLFIEIRSTSEKAMDLYIIRNKQYLK